MIYTFKYLFEKIEKFILNIYQSILSVIKVIVLSKLKIEYPSRNSDCCYILGNGPSFRKSFEQNCELFKTNTLFCVNNFPSSLEYEILKPQNCVFLDPGYFPDDIKTMHPELFKTIENIVSKTQWPINLFLPVLAKNAKHLTDISLTNKNVKIYFFNYTVIKGFPFFKNFLFKKNLGMPLCQNVLGASIYLALNMGYKKVYLLGADHTVGKNIFVDDNNELCMLHEHFYSDGKKTVTSVYNPKVSKNKLNLAGFYMLCVKTFQTYYEIEEYAKYLKAKIYNATEGSFIDAFERRKLEDIS
jgi:hypothetical protein